MARAANRAGEGQARPFTRPLVSIHLDAKKAVKIMTTPDNATRLLHYIKTRAMRKGQMKLNGGGTSDIYIDLRLLTLDGGVAPLVGRVMLDLVAVMGWEFAAVGGLTLGADPVALAMMHVAAQQGKTIDAFVVRKGAKTHGRQQTIEGPDIDGRKVLIVDDVGTTGASLAIAVEAARETGAEVVGAAVVLDRGAGAREKLTALEVPYTYAFNLLNLMF
jgi:orotate phosphoribosyltransferase